MSELERLRERIDGPLRVTVRHTAAEHAGQSGRAEFVGFTHDKESVYRVIFGGPGFEHSAKFRESDLAFDE